MPILSHFPKGSVPRPNQVRVLTEVEQAWDSSDVILIIAPTAAGKSKITATLMKWLEKEKKLKSTWIAPNNLLVEQIEAEFGKELAVIKAKKFFTCTQYWDAHCVPKTCDKVSKEDCEEAGCGPRCPYIRNIIRIKSTGKQVMNNWMFFAATKMKKPKSVVLYDEGHTIIPFLREVAVKKFWKAEWGFPDHICSSEQLLEWAERQMEAIKKDRKLEALIGELRSGAGKYLVRKVTDTYRGVDDDCIEMLPIEVSDGYQSVFGDKRVEKLVLLSATLSLETVRELGLQGKRVTIISSDSPIPVERRKVVYRPLIDNSFSSAGKDFALLCEVIESILKQHEGVKGMVHTTYELAGKLAKRFAGHPRLLSHTRANKRRVFESWTSTEDNRVLIAAGMCEGLDLVGDLCRFQIIAKIPWPSMYDAVVARKAEEDPQWYAWQAAVLTMQAAGRTCRTPDDFGVTYIIDKSFDRLRRSGVLLPWFLDSIVEE